MHWSLPMKLVSFGMYTTSLIDNDIEHMPLDGWDVMERTIRLLPVSLSNTSMKASAVPEGRVMISSTADTSAFAVVVGAKGDVRLELGWKSSVGGDYIVESDDIVGWYVGIAQRSTDVIGSSAMKLDVAVPGTNGIENLVMCACPISPPSTIKLPFDVTL